MYLFTETKCIDGASFYSGMPQSYRERSRLAFSSGKRGGAPMRRL